MTLEARHGDRDATRKRREAGCRPQPSNSLNKLELAKLYADGRRWADATALADQITNKNGSDVAMFKARLRMDQSDAAGAQAMDDHIKSLNPRRSPPAPALFGQFFADRRMYKRGGGDGRAGRACPTSAGTMEIDGMLGRHMRQWPDLAEDPAADGWWTPRPTGVGRRFGCGWSDAQQLGCRDDASKYMEGVTEAANDAIVPLLRGRGGGQGRRPPGAGCRPRDHGLCKDPMVYFRRAQYFLRKNPPMMTEALRTWDASLEVRPGYWQARRTRSLVYVTLGRRDDAIADLRRPSSKLGAHGVGRHEAVADAELIGLGPASEAAEMADDASKVHPDDPVLGGFAVGGVPGTQLAAARMEPYTHTAWKLNKSPDIGQA